MIDGERVGSAVVGDCVGESDGDILGDIDGDNVGSEDVGVVDGDMVGENDGAIDGEIVGSEVVGETDGDRVGSDEVGELVGDNDGDIDGDKDGDKDGDNVGAIVWCEQSPGLTSSSQSDSCWEVTYPVLHRFASKSQPHEKGTPLAVTVGLS